MRGVGLGLLLGCALAVPACHGSDGTTSCVYNLAAGGDAGFVQGVCREWPGGYTEAQQDCQGASGAMDGGITVSPMFVNGPCPRANIVGGCHSVMDGVTFTDWYYPPEVATTADVMNACVQGGTTYVPAP
jgi:hypothetical protein